MVAIARYSNSHMMMANKLVAVVATMSMHKNCTLVWDVYFYQLQLRNHACHGWRIHSEPLVACACHDQLLLCTHVGATTAQITCVRIQSPGRRGRELALSALRFRALPLAPATALRPLRLRRLYRHPMRISTPGGQPSQDGETTEDEQERSKGFVVWHRASTINAPLRDGGAITPNELLLLRQLHTAEHRAMASLTSMSGLLHISASVRTGSPGLSPTLASGTTKGLGARCADGRVT